MESKSIKVLLVEDNPDDILFITRLLSKARGVRIELENAKTLDEGVARVAAGDISAVLLDLNLRDSTGIATFETMQSRSDGTPIIVLSGMDDETVAVAAVHAGAQDYLVKGQVDSQLLIRAILYAIERTQARAAQQQAEAKFRTIFENAVEGIFQTSPEGHYLNVNPALTRIYGYGSPEDLTGKLTDIADMLYVDPSRRDEFIKLMERNDVVTEFESRVYRQDRSVIWISENVRAVRNREGKLLYYEGTVEDITQRKRAEEQLRNSETLYHSLVETLPQNIFRKDLSERFTFANQRFCDTLGRALDQIVGRTDFDFFPPELARKYQRDDRLIMETGQSFETVEEHQPPTGEKIYVQVVKTPLYNAEGKVIGLQGIFWDITERKRAEERERRAAAELARSQQELRKKNETMEDDLRMAHEIQQAMLPQQSLVFPKGAAKADELVRFCYRYHPNGQVGGDFFNVLPISDTQIGVFVCDVMGHGVRSALVTAMIRALVEELRPVATDPGELLTRINRDLRAILQQTGTPLFTTAFYLVADLKTRQITYANAGHPKPFLVHHPTRQVELLSNVDGKAKPALGLFADTAYPSSQRELAAGDAIILFTDGVFEVESGEGTQYSQELLLTDVRGRVDMCCADLFDALLKHIEEFSGTQVFSDDVCLVGMEICALPPVQA